MTAMFITSEVAQRVLSVVDAGLVRGIGTPEPGQMCVEAAVCFALDLPHGDNPACVAPTLRSLKIQLNDSGWSSPAVRAKGLRRLAVSQLGSAGALDEKEFVRRIIDYAIRKSTPLALRAAASVQKDAKHKAALLDAASCCEKEGTRQAILGAKAAINAAYAANAAAAYAANAAEAAANAAEAAANAAEAANAYAANAANAAAYAANAAANAAYAAAYAAYAANAAEAAANAAEAAYAANAAANAAYAAAYAAYAADAADAAYAAYAAADVARDSALSEYAEDIVRILIEMNAPGCQWLPLTEMAA